LGGLITLYRDQPVRLPGGKIGIITRPTVAPAEPLPLVLALNTGVVHRVGHGRMYVTLARRLAAKGHTVLRFDLSGIGDSEKRADALSTLDGALADIGEVMDWLENAVPKTPVVLIGLCMGAQHSLVHGGMDPRVDGVVLLDPFIPHTSRFYVNLYVRKVLRNLFKASAWSGIGRQVLSKLGRRRQPAPEGKGGAENAETALDESFQQRIEDAPVRNQIEQAFKTAIDRRLKMLMVLTGGMDLQHNYRRQLFDAFPQLRFGDLLKLEYWGDTDHVFSQGADRERLFSRIESWLDDARPTGAAARKAAVTEAVAPS
jgi:pimeloyl-ACP methyl ester carboxylesterase